MAPEIGDDDDSAAGGLDLLTTDDLVGAPIATLDQDIREKGGDDFPGGFLGKGRQKIDIIDGAEDLEALRQRKHRTLWPFDLPDRGVGVERHDQHIAQTLGLAEKLDVTAMDKIEAAVGKDDLFPLLAQPGPDLEESG